VIEKEIKFEFEYMTIYHHYQLIDEIQQNVGESCELAVRFVHID